MDYKLRFKGSNEKDMEAAVPDGSNQALNTFMPVLVSCTT
jgi:hypothetical protein